MIHLDFSYITAIVSRVPLDATHMFVEDGVIYYGGTQECISFQCSFYHKVDDEVDDDEIADESLCECCFPPGYADRDAGIE